MRLFGALANQLYLVGILDHSMQLAHCPIITQHIFLVAWLNNMITIEVSEIVSFKQQIFKPIRIQSDVAFQKIQVVDPVVNPIPFAVHRVLNFVSNAEYFFKPRLRLQRSAIDLNQRRK